MIENKEQLKFFLRADLMMNRGTADISIKSKLQNLLIPDYIMKYLRLLRYKEFYKHQKGIINRVLYTFYSRGLYKMGVKLGFSISTDVLGFGVVIPHYGTIVVGEGNKIGNYCVLHTSTCITAGEKNIGNAFYVSSGAKVIGNIQVSDGVTLGANATLNESVLSPYSLYVGTPAKHRCKTEVWYNRDGEEYIRRVSICEKWKQELGNKRDG